MELMEAAVAVVGAEELVVLLEQDLLLALEVQKEHMEVLAAQEGGLMGLIILIQLQEMLERIR